jgi:hypothetical protein
MFVSVLPPTEFIGTSITSTGYGEYYAEQGFSRAQIDEVEQSLIRQNRWMYDVNFGCKGGCVTFSAIAEDTWLLCCYL